MKMTVQTPPTTHHTNSMSVISQLLFTRFSLNFNGGFLGTSRTSTNCYGDICAGNTCPCDICSYQEYLSCDWPNFDQTLGVGPWDHLEQILPPKNFRPPPKIWPSKKFCQIKMFAKKTHYKKNFVPKKKFSPK